MLIKLLSFSTKGYNYDHSISLEELQNEYIFVLHEGLVVSCKNRLQNYLANFENEAMILNLGGCQLELKGLQEAEEALNALEYALETRFSKK